jgi:hypothetical protein
MVDHDIVLRYWLWKMYFQKVKCCYVICISGKGISGVHEWCSKIDNGVTEVKEIVLSCIRAVAYAATNEKCDEAVEALKKSNIWKTNAKPRQ